ncbi:MAG TPA: peptidoglycan-associated lipoprotein Pal [Burkholderiales bacterium]|nr:peptidoglycan-associated lipoprotein Pal [Burkholderiales bacterium]
MKKFLFSIVMLGVLAGCASTDTKEQPAAAVEDRKPGVTEVRPSTETPPQVTPVKPPIIVGDPLDPRNPKSILAKRSVYYDYDSSVVKDEYKPLVTAHSQYLTKNRATKITIQGNTDERGSREYNLALGQRRADSVKQMMILLGAQESQIESVSFGEEKPRATGKDEAAFSENRRSDIVYQGE